jgi:hypothetical protein
MFEVLTGKLKIEEKRATWVAGIFLREQNGRGVKLTTHLLLEPRLRMCGAMPPLPHKYAQRGV